MAVAAASRFASLFDGLVHQFLFDPEFRELAQNDLAQRPAPQPPRTSPLVDHWLPPPPGRATGRGQRGRADVLELVELEGLSGWLPHLAPRWESAREREVILWSARAVESEPSLLGLSAHLLLVAPTSPGGKSRAHCEDYKAWPGARPGTTRR